MTYETIDWELEAKRVRRAFGLDDEYRFKLSPQRLGAVRWEESRVLWQEHTMDELPLPELEGVSFSCEYEVKQGKSFYIGIFDEDEMVGITFDWNDRPFLQSESTEFALLLAKGLFHLDLLTPQVEAILEVTITAHQKVEWAREYDERYGL